MAASFLKRKPKEPDRPQRREIPVLEAAEMTPIDPSVGEFRVHYAGFFDPGFGTDEAHGKGSKGVLEVRSGTLTLDGACALERGRVEITGGTVVLQGGLWLGEGEVVIRGGEVIVPGGLDGLIAERGSVTVEGGTLREP